MDPEARRELDLLEALSNDTQLTQRRLSAKLGVALGLTNLYLKRLVQKGYLKCVNGRANRLRYVITPTGMAEKTRLTYEFRASTASGSRFTGPGKPRRSPIYPCESSTFSRRRSSLTGEERPF
jgi:hypothetical protein